MLSGSARTDKPDRTMLQTSRLGLPAHGCSGGRERGREVYKGRTRNRNTRPCDREVRCSGRLASDLYSSLSLWERLQRAHKGGVIIRLASER